MRRVIAAFLVSGLLSLSGISAAQAQDASGRSMFLNLKLGPAIGAKDSDTQFAIAIDFGFAPFSNKNAFFTFSPQFHVAGGTTVVMIPVGFQYDFALPWKNFYAYPRVSLGYGGVFRDPISQNGFMFEPAFGVKYVLNDRWNIGFEPFSLPISVTDLTPIWYRIFAYFGAKF